MMLAEEATERAIEHLAQLPFHMRIIGTLFRSVDTAFEITIGLLCLGSLRRREAIDGWGRTKLLGI